MDCSEKTWTFSRIQALSVCRRSHVRGPWLTATGLLDCHKALG